MNLRTTALSTACLLLATASAHAACGVGPQTLATQSNLFEKEIDALTGDGKDVTPVACNWRTPSYSPPTNCGISSIRVEGKGMRPTEIVLYREVDNVFEDHNTNGYNSIYPNIRWHSQINFNKNNHLNCAANTCPHSRYSVQLSTTQPPLFCRQKVDVVFTLRD